MKVPERNWVVAAIDPGRTPTICVLWDRGQEMRFFEDADVAGYLMENPHDRKPKHRDVPDPAKIKAVLEHHSPHLVVIEKVWVMPHQGISSQAKLVYCYGLCNGIARGCGYSTLEVFPQTWLRYWGLIGSDKRKHRERAVQVEAEVAKFVTRVKDHDRADSYLMGVFGLHYLDKVYADGVRRGLPLDHIPAMNVIR